jgi:hypothetical protein
MNAVLTIPCDTKRRAIIIAHGAQTRQDGFVGKGGPSMFSYCLLSRLRVRTSTFLIPERAPNKATRTQGHTLGLLQFII